MWFITRVISDARNCSLGLSTGGSYRGVNARQPRDLTILVSAPVYSSVIVSLVQSRITVSHVRHAAIAHITELG